MRNSKLGLRLVSSLLLALFPLLPALGQGKDNQAVWQYLRLELQPKSPSQLSLHEIQVQDQSPLSPYTKPYLYLREEFETQGRPYLRLFYNPQGQVQQKTIFFYPHKLEQIIIFFRQGQALDTLIQQFNPLDSLLAQSLNFWGASQTRDTALFHYHPNQQPRKIQYALDWDNKTDSFFYHNSGLIQKVVSFDRKGQYQREIQCFFDTQNRLIKVAEFDHNRQIKLEDFFYYDEQHRLRRQIRKFYQETQRQNQRLDFYYRGSKLRKRQIRDYNAQKQILSKHLSHYNRFGLVRKEREQSSQLRRNFRHSYRFRS